MIPFELEIENDIYWRQSQISTLKILLHRASITEDQRDVLRFYLVLAIYSLWEGFIKTVFTIYITEINKLNLNTADFHINYITHTLESEKSTNIAINRVDVLKRRKCINDIILSISASPFKISANIPTESNVNLNTLNRITETFHLDKVNSRYKFPLDEFLRCRNQIAHGENAVKINNEKIDNFITLIYELMEQVYSIVIDGFNNKKFLK